MATRKAASKPEAKKPVPRKSASPTPEELWKQIAEAAYYRAKARDFAPGGEVQDWIEAEAEVKNRLGRSI